MICFVNLFDNILERILMTRTINSRINAEANAFGWPEGREYILKIIVGNAAVESKNEVGIRLENPAVKRMEAASPIPRPNPNSIPARIPGNACLRMTLNAVSNFVDPKE
jgi:hypothetical protein